MHTKQYTIVTRSYINRRVVCKGIQKFTIQCLGGEKNMSEKPQISFVDLNNIPNRCRGYSGRDWNKVFAEIPEGKGAVIPPEVASNATVRQAVATVNEALKKANPELKKDTYSVFQRTVKEGDKDKVVMYVVRA